MKLRVVPALEAISDADDTVQHFRVPSDDGTARYPAGQPAVEKVRRPRIVQVRPPAFERAAAVMTGHPLAPGAERRPLRPASRAASDGSIAPISLDVVRETSPAPAPPAATAPSAAESVPDPERMVTRAPSGALLLMLLVFAGTAPGVAAVLTWDEERAQPVAHERVAASIPRSLDHSTAARRLLLSSATAREQGYRPR